MQQHLFFPNWPRWSILKRKNEAPQTSVTQHLLGGSLVASAQSAFSLVSHSGFLDPANSPASIERHQQICTGLAFFHKSDPPKASNELRRDTSADNPTERTWSV